jgi:hypothetical protein
MGSNGCTCRNKGADKYTWEPSNCILAPWDAAEFCLLLGTKNVLLIGDSVMMQVAAVLKNRIAMAFLGRPGSCAGSIRMQRSDILVPLNDTAYRGPRKPWGTFVPRADPRSLIVVLTAGPHVTNARTFATILEQVVRDHRERLPGVSLVWQSQLGGGCAWPDPARERPDRAFWAKYARTHRLFNYGLLAAYDSMARRAFPGPNRHYLDISPIALRLDGRVGSWPGSPNPNNCLHFCHPGPLDDLIPRLYLQLLRELGAGR